METEQCTWAPFYMEFADKLLVYKADRQELLAKIKRAFDAIDRDLPTLDSCDPAADIDPFTVYGLFNKWLKDENRLKIIGALVAEFGIDAPLPTDFAGVPLVMNTSATFYAFSSDARRRDGDIDRLWAVFEAAIRYADMPVEATRDVFVHAYDDVMGQLFIKWNLTMGLFWTRPYSFISLEKTNKDLLGRPDRMSEDVNAEINALKSPPDASTYLALCSHIKTALESGAYGYRDFPGLSKFAWEESKRQAAEKKAREKEAQDTSLGDGGIPSVEIDGAEVDYPAYSKEDFLGEVYMDEESYDDLVELLDWKKNVILEGAPGVGKTFAAKRLAYSMMGVKDPARVMLVQFHQSYSYEDFIEGFRPNGKVFDLVQGAFYSFCKEASEDEDNDYFFIIDEINRGDLSKIFGELFMLVEADKRGEKNKLQLLYSHEPFYVPSNIHIIGMMNTADRGLALLDYALRRRFAFFDLRPGLSSAGFCDYLASVGSPKLDALVDAVEELNEAIADDETLGEGFCVGHSYFCGLAPEDATDRRLGSIVDYELVPLLKEYWFDDPAKVRHWTKRLRGAVH